MEDLKHDLINEFNNSLIKIEDNSIKFIKNEKIIFIYDVKNGELLTTLYPIGDNFMKKYGLSKSEFSEIIKNFIKFNI